MSTNRCNQCHNDTLKQAGSLMVCDVCGSNQPLPFRLERDELFMAVAMLFAARSSCLRGHVGAVIVKDGRIVSCGYNGAPPGMPHCFEVGCLPDQRLVDLEVVTILDTQTVSKESAEGMAYNQVLEQHGCVRTIHAELNAIAWAARAGVSLEEATLYNSHAPCRACAQAIIAAGITEVYYRKDYRAAALDLLDQANVIVRKI
jgi:dCMP deaminase